MGRPQNQLANPHPLIVVCKPILGPTCQTEWGTQLEGCALQVESNLDLLLRSTGVILWGFQLVLLSGHRYLSWQKVTSADGVGVPPGPLPLPWCCFVFWGLLGKCSTSEPHPSPALSFLTLKKILEAVRRIEKTA